MNSIPPILPPMPASLTNGPAPNASPERMGQAFESVFASMLIKQMRESLDSETMFGNDPGDILGGMFDQFLGEQLGRSGAFGIARMIRAQMERRGGAT